MIKCINPKAIQRPFCWVTNQHCVHDCNVDNNLLIWFRNIHEPGDKDYVCSLCGKNITKGDQRTILQHSTENLEARFHLNCFLTAREDGKI